jgi:hypothetical protein
MMLLPEATKRHWCALTMTLIDGTAATALVHPELEALRRGNEAARALPLLDAIAAGQGGRVLVPYLGHAALAIEVTQAAHPALSSTVNRSKTMGDV